MNETCHTYEWVMSHNWLSHVTNIIKSFQTYECVTSYMCRSLVMHRGEQNISCNHVNLHICTNHVTNMQAIYCTGRLIFVVFFLQMSPEVRGWLPSCWKRPMRWSLPLSARHFVILNIYAYKWQMWHPCIHTNDTSDTLNMYTYKITLQTWHGIQTMTQIGVHTSTHSCVHTICKGMCVYMCVQFTHIHESRHIYASNSLRRTPYLS